MTGLNFKMHGKLYENHSLRPKRRVGCEVTQQGEKGLD